MLQLPEFPWNTLREFAQTASQHLDGIVDLSVGTPVDPTPKVIQQALQAASDAPGYPQVHGTPQLREAIAEWYARRRFAGRVHPDAVMPSVGSKEIVAWLPTLLGFGAGHTVAFPNIAYPTYEIGALLAGSKPRPYGALLDFGPQHPDLLWLNSPGNPTGAVLGVEHLRKVVDWARHRGVIVASDECYAELDWRDLPRKEQAPSILDDRVCGGDHTGLLSVYSLSKQSNLAGYRAAWVAGDLSLVTQLVEVRKHAGMMVPSPVQAAVIAAVTDDAHVAAQKEKYRRRREKLLPAVVQAGLRVDHSEAGLYLWATQDLPARETLASLARLGILAAPGDFYGRASGQYVRLALTASDERIAAAAQRLQAASSL